MDSEVETPLSVGAPSERPIAPEVITTSSLGANGASFLSPASSSSSSGSNVNWGAVGSLQNGSAAISSEARQPSVPALSTPLSHPVLYPPENFTQVSGQVYRSGFPRRKHLPFLQHKGLRSILTLVLEDYPDGNLAWMEKSQVKLYQFGVAGNKEPFVDIPEEVIADALAVLLDRRNHPILIHCNKGKHRTGCLVGCLRRLESWSLAATFDEYRRFSAPKSRSLDMQFIELFDPSLVWKRIDPRWLPHWPTLEPPLILLRGLSFPSVPKDEEQERSLQT